MANRTKRPLRCKVTVSAGGVVTGPQGMVLLVNQRGTSLSLPKGHIDPGEEALTAAKREIGEEAGIAHLSFVRYLGVYGRYKIGRFGGEDHGEWKTVIFFQFKTRTKKLCPQDGHNPQAFWTHPDKVAGLLTHPKDRSFFRSIRHLLK